MVEYGQTMKKYIKIEEKVFYFFGNFTLIQGVRGAIRECLGAIPELKNLTKKMIRKIKFVLTQGKSRMPEMPEMLETPPWVRKRFSIDISIIFHI